VLILLLITIVFIFFISILLFKGDFIHPGMIISEVFLFSTLCALYNVNLWAIDLSWKTYTVIIFGIVIFVVTAYSATLCLRLFNWGSLETEQSQVIEIPKIQHIFSIAFSLFSGFYYVKEVLRIARSVGGGSKEWSVIMYHYRQATSYGVLEEGQGMSGLAGHMYDLMIALSYVYLFIIINNLLIQGVKVKKSLFLPLIISSITTFMSAARIQVLYFAMAAVVFFFILTYKKYGKDMVNAKQLIKIACFLIVIFICFVSLRGVIGRGLSEKASSDPLYYFTVYAGGPIPLLDSFLKSPPVSSEIFGKELFFRINRFIGGTFNIPELIYISHKEFRYSVTGYSLGNVYTAFRSYIYDFGMSGLLLFTTLTSAFYSFFYGYVKLKPVSQKKSNTALIIYGYMVSGVFLMSISERLFSIFFSVNSLKMICFIYLANIFLTRMKFSR
jgi:oligosaccharide repeat unit polymerase